MNPLDSAVTRFLTTLFPDPTQQHAIREQLDRITGPDQYRLKRLQIAILRYSEGDMSRFEDACKRVDDRLRACPEGAAYLSSLLAALPTKAELAMARAQAPTACPRRHCWWWRSLSFEWEVSVERGCTFMAERDSDWRPTDWPDRDRPCKRCDPTSTIDQFEPREPHMMEDGFVPDHWSDEASGS